MPYDPQHPANLADKVADMGIAFKDGFQLAEDSDEIMALVPAGLAAADEFKEDLPSTLMYIGAQLMKRGADLRREMKEAEAADGDGG
jgi:hypothetical protein